MNVNPKKITITTFFISKEEYEKISDVNKKIATKYIDAIRSNPRIKSEHTIDYNAKIIGFLIKKIKTDLSKLTIDDIDDIQSAISKMKHVNVNKTDVAPTTKQQYRIGIRRFLHWAGGRYDRPDYEKLAKELTLDKARAPHKDPKELFTVAEIDSMIAAAKELRDKAIIAVLAESGCRAGELLSCQVKSVVFNNNGCKFTVKGKTGERTVDLVFASPYIDHYLRSEHPYRDTPEAPLWMSKYHSSPAALSYSGLDDIVKKIGHRAGIKKRVHLHNFRHTTATQLARIWTEPIMKKYLGWTGNSNMPSIYISLGGEDMEAAVLTDRYGIVEKKQNDKGLEVGKCPKCWKTIPATATFCYNCGMPLTKDAQKDTNTAVTDFAAFINSDPKLMSKLMTLLQQQQ